MAWLAQVIVEKWKQNRMECNMCNEWSWYDASSHCVKCRQATPDVVSAEWHQLEQQKQHFDAYLRMLEEQKKGLELEQLHLRQMQHQKKLMEEQDMKAKKERRRLFLQRQKERAEEHAELLKLEKLNLKKEKEEELANVKSPPPSSVKKKNG